MELDFYAILVTRSFRLSGRMNALASRLSVNGFHQSNCTEFHFPRVPIQATFIDLWTRLPFGEKLTQGSLKHLIAIYPETSLMRRTHRHGESRPRTGVSGSDVISENVRC